VSVGIIGGTPLPPLLLFFSFVGVHNGARVFVAVADGVGVNVAVVVAVGVCVVVGVSVRVLVGLNVFVGVNVFVTVGVGLPKKPPKLLSHASHASKISKRRIIKIITIDFGFIFALPYYVVASPEAQTPSGRIDLLSVGDCFPKVSMTSIIYLLPLYGMTLLVYFPFISENAVHQSIPPSAFIKLLLT